MTHVAQPDLRSRFQSYMDEMRAFSQGVESAGKPEATKQQKGKKIALYEMTVRLTKPPALTAVAALEPSTRLRLTVKLGDQRKKCDFDSERPAASRARPGVDVV